MTRVLKQSAGPILGKHGAAPSGTMARKRRAIETWAAEQGELLRMIALADPLADILGAICRSVGRLGYGTRCCVFLIDDPYGHIRVHAAYDLSPDAARLMCRLARGRHATSYPIDGREAHIAHLPIQSRGADMLGGLVILRTGQARAPEADLTSLTHIARIAIERARDEAALRQAERHLGEARRVMGLGHLAASIAHEISQPLTGIITNAAACLHMLDGSAPRVEGARETARRTLRDGRRATQIIDRLRALFAGRPGEVAAVDLNEVSIAALEACRAEIDRHGVVLRTAFARDLPGVEVDRVQIQQVLRNLIVNACEQMAAVDRRARSLLVATRHDGDVVRVSVADTGPGFDPDSRDRLFEPMFTTKPAGMGMGMGLFVSRAIIQRHSGRLDVENNEGPGATFSFELPRLPVVESHLSNIRHVDTIACRFDDIAMA